MVKSKNYLGKLKQWRKDKEEEYARTIMMEPEKSTILKRFHVPGVILIMGGRRGGKTATAHKIGEEIHKHIHIPVMVHLPKNTTEKVQKRIAKMLPSYAEVTTKKDQWKKHSVVIYDEAAQTAHARRTQSGEAVELDNLIGISGQRDQLFIFICHHSRKLDPNVVREVNHIIWKRPTYAYQIFERDELSDFTMKAFDYFNVLRAGKNTDATKRMLKQHSLVLDFDDFKFYTFMNQLPSYWTEGLSTLFEDINTINHGEVNYVRR